MLARRRPESGAAAVEFALVLPVLFLIIGAIIDFGFIFAQQISFNTSARDAARAGVLPSVAGAKQTCAQVATRARNAASSGAVGASALSIRVEVTGAGGTCILSRWVGRGERSGNVPLHRLWPAGRGQERPPGHADLCVLTAVPRALHGRGEPGIEGELPVRVHLMRPSRGRAMTRRDERGGVAMIVALLLVPMMLLIAFTLDLGIAYAQAQAFAAGADSGALAIAEAKRTSLTSHASARRTARR